MTEERAVAKVEALPASFQEVSGLAKAFVASGMFTDTKQLSQAIVKIQAGRELGLPPVYSMQNINLIRNRLTTSANTMAMLVKKSGHYNYRIKVHDEKVCTISFFEKDGDKWLATGESTFTMDDAKRADLIKPDSGWMKYPRAMLFSRAISQGARIYCPDAIGGVYTDEEIRSIPPRPEDTTTNVVVEADAKQAEKDIEKYWPVSHPGASPEDTEEVATTTYSPPPEATKQPTEAVDEGADGIDIGKVRETLKIIKWPDNTAKSWLRSQFKVDVEDKLEDILASLDTEQLKGFMNHISSMREAAGK